MKTCLLSSIRKKWFLTLIFICYCLPLSCSLPLYYWRQDKFVNFGDYISLKLVEQIVQEPVEAFRRSPKDKRIKLLAIGSILSFASNNDIIWGTGANGKVLKKEHYSFQSLDVRSVRGPLTRKFLQEAFAIEVPEIYGDPALLFPYFFPNFTKSQNPKHEYLIIPHYSERHLFPKEIYPNVIYPTDPWTEVIGAIVDSKFVIASSLHGIIIAESYGIPARMLRVTENEPIFKYQDYYFGTNRPDFCYATSIEEALLLQGEKPFDCDLKQLYNAFPKEYWPNTTFKELQ